MVQTQQTAIDRRADFELLVLDAIAELVRSPSRSRPLAMDNCAAKIMSFIDMSAAQRRERLERIAKVRMLERREDRT